MRHCLSRQVSLQQPEPTACWHLPGSVCHSCLHPLRNALRRPCKKCRSMPECFSSSPSRLARPFFPDRPLPPGGGGKEVAAAVECAQLERQLIRHDHAMAAGMATPPPPRTDHRWPPPPLRLLLTNTRHAPPPRPSKH